MKSGFIKCISLVLFVSLSLLSIGQTTAQKTQKPPNIILLLVDDLGWMDIGSYGSSFYETPNIDKLTKEGIKFTNAYSACNVCSPSRASILTGKYPARLHITDWIDGYEKPYAKLLPPVWTRYLPLEEITIAEILKKKNYASASIGKWHLGDDVKYYPEHQGFDLNIGGYYAGSPPTYFSPYRIPRLKNGDKGEYLTDRLTDEAIKFMDEEKNGPFFLYLPYYAVHTPIQAKEADVEAFKLKVNPSSPQQNPVYAAMIKSVDESVGRILQYVKEKGLEDNTIIIFTSDNGGLIRSKNPITSNLPLREGKGTAYEGGVRVPLIVKWKGKIKENTQSNVPIIGTDLFPTLAAVTNSNISSISNIDGVNIAPLLFGDQTLKRDALYWHYPHYHSEGATPYSSIREGDYKLISFYENGKIELFNLKNDLSEQNNLIDKEPKMAAMLLKKLTAWKHKTGAQDPLINPKYDIKRANQITTSKRIVKDSLAGKEEL
jgi:arylsulfatase A